MSSLLAVLLCISLASCTGYHLGGTKPPSLAAIKSIAVPMFQNATLHPRAESLATAAMADSLVQDGTYRLAKYGSADAILEGTLANIEYSTLRSSRIDSLLAEELTNTVSISWVLKDGHNPTKILASGVANGASSFFVDSNLQVARQNALPDALDRAAQGVVSKLASGY